MILHHVGYNHRHDADFQIERPDGTGDCLLLILKSPAIFTLDGRDVTVGENTFFFYPKGVPQYYRAVPQHEFVNDFIHFDFEGDEPEWFSLKYVPVAEPAKLRSIEFLSFCIKAIADENSSAHLHKEDSISHYFWLLCNKVSEQVHEQSIIPPGARYEPMLIIRNKIYNAPYLEWSVNWAAHETCMSRSAFQHHYKEQFGVTFIQDLILSRISHAKMLLRTTNMSIQDIALQCGYRSYEHFARQFRRHCGIAPTDFRSTKQDEKENT